MFTLRDLIEDLKKDNQDEVVISYSVKTKTMQKSRTSIDPNCNKIDWGLKPPSDYINKV